MRTGVALAVILVVVFLVFTGAFTALFLGRFNLGCVSPCGSASGDSSSTLTSSSGPASSTSALNTTAASSPVSSTLTFGTGNDWLTDNPSLVNGSTKIDAPPNYSEFVNYTLTLINADRASSGASPVALSSVLSGQQHADSLAYFGTIGHWDVQGYKPYMRYTLLGGQGSVAENVAFGYCTDSPINASEVSVVSCDVKTVENSIAGMEYFMMNNDVTCCNNGHRDDILNPSHTDVSIGVAFNFSSKEVYLVEDFEDSYINSESLQVSGNVVTLTGTTQKDMTGWTSGSSGAGIGVFYDPTPTGIPTSELTNSASCRQYSELHEPPACQYQGGYGQGTQATTVLAPCPPLYMCDSGSQFTFAQTWQVSSGTFQVSFSLSTLESTYGPGVYTLYLYPNGDLTDPITSLSIFVSGP